jgi:carboxymethylenebutenolidase
MSGQRVDLPTPDGVMDTYTFQPQGDGPWPAVIIYMDAFGIRPQLDEMAERLAAEGFFVVVPNLYYRSGPFAPFDPKQVFVEGPEQQRFRGMIQSITPTMIMRDTGPVLDYLDNEPCARDGRIGAVGYCMGGGYAISAMGTFPGRVVAGASFHGASLATDKPDSPHLLASRIRGRLYVGVAGIDPGFPPEQRDRLEKALSDAGTDYTLEIYEGAKHGFAVTGHPVYDRDASERHWTTLIRLFNDTLYQQSAGV